MKRLSLICISAISLLVGFQSAVSAPGDSIRTKIYNGPYEVNELGGAITNAPFLDVNGTKINPIADDQTDLTIFLEGDIQIWNLLEEFTPWKDVNIFGYYTDINSGHNLTAIFGGPDDPGYQLIKDLSPTEVGLWLHNDTNGDSLYNGDDSFLYSQRDLTRGSACPEHQWFMVYDVSSYIGTNAQYNFHCNTENFSTAGDFHYLVFIDDDHTSANFDHNDMILGVLYDSAPLITCPSDLNLDCSESSDPLNTGFAAAVDDLDPAPAIAYSDTQDGNLITRVWTATDYNGNSSSCVQIITTVDTTPPSISCPADLSVQCFDEIPISNLNQLNVSDDCDPNPVVTHVSDISDGLTCPETITRTYRATDLSGNYAECAQIITVMDDIAPEIICPANIVIECAGSIDPEFTGSASANDNCVGELAITYTDSQVDNVITRTWFASDGCGNSSECPQIITLIDTTDPVITTCPDDISTQCSEDLPAPDISAVMTTDTCDPNPVVTHVGDSSDGLTCPETITRIYRVTDLSGNYSECTQIITVMDDIAPEIICPANIVIECAGSIDPEFTGSASANDNCVGELAITYTDSQVDNVITRTWSASDGCGNSSECPQIITLIDTTDPVITTCPADINVQCSEDVPAPDISAVMTTDICDPNPIVTYVGDSSDGLTCPETITRTYRATDLSGNYADCTQIITVMDDIAPEITCPGNLTISCFDPTEPEVTGYPTVSDNCDAPLDVTFTEEITEELITRIWTVTDACGNYSDCVQLIAITENLSPVVECPGGPVTVIVPDLEDEICFNDITYYDPDGEIESVLVNGVTMSGSDICFVPQNWGPNQVTIICFDLCGAQAECSFTVIVGACYFLPGDANVDAVVNVSDVVAMLGHLTVVSELPDDGQCNCYPNVPEVPFYGGADANGSCRFNVADVVYLYDYLSGSGAQVHYCPLCPPTEGWFPLLRDPGGDPEPMLKSRAVRSTNN